MYCEVYLTTTQNIFGIFYWAFNLQHVIPMLASIEEYLYFLPVNILSKLCLVNNNIFDDLRLNIEDKIKSLSDLKDEKERTLIIDILGFYILKNDSKRFAGFKLHPPNKPPDRPQDLGKEDGINWNRTKTADPNPGDMVRFQWKWNGIHRFWSYFRYNQNQYHRKPHAWILPGQKIIKVRTKNSRLALKLQKLYSKQFHSA